MGIHIDKLLFCREVKPPITTRSAWYYKTKWDRKHGIHGISQSTIYWSPHHFPNYPLVIQKAPSLIAKSSINGPCSIAMSVCWRVHKFSRIQPMGVTNTLAQFTSLYGVWKGGIPLTLGFNGRLLGILLGRMAISWDIPSYIQLGSWLVQPSCLRGWDDKVVLHHFEYLSSRNTCSRLWRSCCGAFFRWKWSDLWQLSRCGVLAAVVAGYLCRLRMAAANREMTFPAAQKNNATPKKPVRVYAKCKPRVGTYKMITPYIRKKKTHNSFAPQGKSQKPPEAAGPPPQRQ